MRKKTIIYKIIGSSAKCLVFIGKKLVSTICLLTGRNITSAKRKAIKKWGIYVWLRS